MAARNNTTRRKATKKHLPSALEQERRRLFDDTVGPELLPVSRDEPTTIRQLGQLRVVPSVATYGAYEDPI